MNLDSQIVTETCRVVVGEYGDICDRALGHDGPHTRITAHGVYHYSSDNARQFVFGYCGTCHELITDNNRGVGSCTQLNCREHIGPCQKEYRESNACRACGFEGKHEMYNYDPIWHDGDIHCGRCGAYIRMFDAG